MRLTVFAKVVTNAVFMTRYGRPRLKYRP